MKYDPTNVLFTNFLIIGPPKTGKTYSLATLHKLHHQPGQTLHIHDFDEGCQPLVRLARAGGWFDELRPFRYPRAGGDKLSQTETPARSKEPFLDFITAINALYDQVGPDGRWLPTFKEAPYAIVIDSLTSLSDDILSFTLSLRGKELGRAGVDGRAEYGTQMSKIIETVKSLRALPCFTVFLAHEQTEMEMVGGTEKAPMPTGRVHRLPLVTGKLAFSIGAEFGGVFYTTVEAGKYLWITQPTDTVRSAGSRLADNLSPKVEQDFSLIVK